MNMPINHRMEILDPSGHTEITWDADNAQEVATAREMFNAMIAKGYQAFEQGTSKGQRGNRVTSFDPDLEKLVLFPHLQGG